MARLKRTSHSSRSLSNSGETDAVGDEGIDMGSSGIRDTGGKPGLPSEYQGLAGQLGDPWGLP